MQLICEVTDKCIYKGSFLLQTIRNWNALLESVIFSAEIADDCVAMSTSQVRARYYEVLVNDCQCWRFIILARPDDTSSRSFAFRPLHYG